MQLRVDSPIESDLSTYAKLTGRAGGQTLNLGLNAGEGGTLSSNPTATKGKIYLGTLSVYDEVNDRLGIGITSPACKFNLYDSFTDTSITRNAAYIDMRPIAISDVTAYDRAMSIFCCPDILTEKTNSGYCVGIYGAVVRNYLTGNSDNGILTLMRGGWIQYGHFNIEGGNAPTTVTMYGLHLAPLCYTGSFGTLYDLYIASRLGAIVPTIHFAIYQQETTAKNYFGGKVGILDTSPTEVLDVTGNINATGVMKIDDVQVIGNRVIDVRLDDAIGGTWDAAAQGVLDALRDLVLSHGLGAVA